MMKDFWCGCSWTILILVVIVLASLAGRAQAPPLDLEARVKALEADAAKRDIELKAKDQQIADLSKKLAAGTPQEQAQRLRATLTQRFKAGLASDAAAACKAAGGERVLWIILQGQEGPACLGKLKD